MWRREGACRALQAPADPGPDQQSSVTHTTLTNNAVEISSNDKLKSISIRCGRIPDHKRPSVLLGRPPLDALEPKVHRIALLRDHLKASQALNNTVTSC